MASELWAPTKKICSGAVHLISRINEIVHCHGVHSFIMLASGCNLCNKDYYLCNKDYYYYYYYY